MTHIITMKSCKMAKARFKMRNNPSRSRKQFKCAAKLEQNHIRLKIAHGLKRAENTVTHFSSFVCFCCLLVLGNAVGVRHLYQSNLSGLPCRHAGFAGCAVIVVAPCHWEKVSSAVAPLCSPVIFPEDKNNYGRFAGGQAVQGGIR